MFCSWKNRTCKSDILLHLSEEKKNKINMYFCVCIGLYEFDIWLDFMYFKNPPCILQLLLNVQFVRLSSWLVGKLQHVEYVLNEFRSVNTCQCVYYWNEIPHENVPISDVNTSALLNQFAIHFPPYSFNECQLSGKKEEDGQKKRDNVGA